MAAMLLVVVVTCAATAEMRELVASATANSPANTSAAYSDSSAAAEHAHVGSLWVRGAWGMSGAV